MKYLFLRESILQAGTVFLRGRDYHHVIRVLRYKIGDELWVYLAGTSELICTSIELIEKKQAILKILRSSMATKAGSLNIHLVLPWLKREALVLSLQQAVETGVSSITLVASDFSVADKSNFGNRQNKYEKLIEQAGQQSGNPYLPELKIEESFENFIKNAEAEKVYPFFYAHPQNDSYSSLLSPLAYMRTLNFTACYVFIGPEGGWSERELSLFKGIQAFQINFPTYTLRACTASLYLISLIQSLYKEVINEEDVHRR